MGTEFWNNINIPIETTDQYIQTIRDTIKLEGIYKYLKNTKVLLYDLNVLRLWENLGGRCLSGYISYNQIWFEMMLGLDISPLNCEGETCSLPDGGKQTENKITIFAFISNKYLICKNVYVFTADFNTIEA